MANMYLMIGLPASGKTTRAYELLKEDGNAIRVNKDELRPMLHGDRKWSGKQEKRTNMAQEAIIRESLDSGVNVIVDDTNLNTKRVNRLISIATNNGHKVQGHDFSNMTVETCIERDFDRGEKVGRDVIYNMAFKNGLLKQENPLVVFDLDGTLADITERREKSIREDGSMDWNEFFKPENVRLDRPRPDIFEWVDKVKTQGYDIAVVSGRSDVTRAETEKWLFWHGTDYISKRNFGSKKWPWWNRLIMRQQGDHRPDGELKLWFLDNFLPADKIEYVVDDRPRVVRAWESRGINVYHVGPKNEDGSMMEF